MSSTETAHSESEDVYVESATSPEVEPTGIAAMLQDVLERAERGDPRGEDLEVRQEYWIRKRDMVGHLATFVLQSPQDIREATEIVGKADVQAVRTNGRITGVIAEDE